jgi:hypothetical protein
MAGTVRVIAVVFAIVIIVVAIVTLAARLGFGIILAAAAEVGTIWILAVLLAIVVVVFAIAALTTGLMVSGVRVKRLTAVFCEFVEVKLVEHDSAAAFYWHVVVCATNRAVEVAVGLRVGVATARLQSRGELGRLLVLAGFTSATSGNQAGYG